MPKNTTGGKGHKKLANGVSKFVEREYKKTSNLELDAYVVKIIGNGNILVNSIDGKYTNIICVIRGKFKGRNKSRNIIETNSIVVIGLREWENPLYTFEDLKWHECQLSKLDETKSVYILVGLASLQGLVKPTALTVTDYELGSWGS
jgi:hypothetical protein